MEAKKEVLRSAFSKVDTNNKGKITYAQMKDVLKEMFGVRGEKEDPGDPCWEMADFNNDKLISYEELLLFFFNTELEFEDFAKAAFRMCDTSGDGFVDKKEIRAKDCRLLVAMFDEDFDGKLNYQEFCNMIKDGEILDSD